LEVLSRRSGTTSSSHGIAGADRCGRRARHRRERRNSAHGRLRQSAAV